jgi:hypothetical protein
MIQAQKSEVSFFPKRRRSVFRSVRESKHFNMTNKDVHRSPSSPTTTTMTTTRVNECIIIYK